MASDKVIFETLKNNKYKSFIPESLQIQFQFDHTEKSKFFNITDSIFENVEDKFDMDKLEEEQSSIINKIEDFKNETIQLYLEENEQEREKRLVERVDIDKLDTIPKNLQIKLREFFGNKFFKIGIPTSDSLYYSVLTLVDPHFYFKQMEEKQHLVRELKNLMVIDLSEKNLHTIFKYGRKRWSLESIMNEIKDSYKCSIKTITYIGNYFNKNIIIFNTKDSIFEKTDNIDYNKGFLVLVSNYSLMDINNGAKYHFEPIMTDEIKELTWSNQQHKNFLSSIEFISDEISIKNYISEDKSVNVNKKKYKKSELLKLGVEDIRNIANLLNLELTFMKNGTMKNITKNTLIEEILKIQDSS